MAGFALIIIRPTFERRDPNDRSAVGMCKEEVVYRGRLPGHVCVDGRIVRPRLAQLGLLQHNHVPRTPCRGRRSSPVQPSFSFVILCVLVVRLGDCENLGRKCMSGLSAAARPCMPASREITRME